MQVAQTQEETTKITANQLRRIIKEEVQKVVLKEDSSLSVVDADSNEMFDVAVEEGPVPYSVRLKFGASFGITLDHKDAADLARMLGEMARIAGM